MPTKLVVTESDKGRVVSLESSRGNTLLMSAPLADKRATAAAVRSIKAVLKDSVAVDDRTITRPARPARIAPAAKGAKATTAPVAASPVRKTRAAKGPAAPPAPAAAAALESAPKTRKRAARTAK
jgi:hypothetical protein